MPRHSPKTIILCIVLIVSLQSWFDLPKRYTASLVAQTVRNPHAMWETWFSPWVGKICGEGNGYLVQYSYLEISKDRIAWQASVHGVTKSQTQLRHFHFTSLQSVQFSRSFVSDSLWPHGLQHIRPPRPSPIPRVYSTSCLLSWWCHLTISSSVVPFSCLQPFLASGSFQMSQFFTSGGHNIGISALASVFPMSIQDWFPLGPTGWISLLSMGFSVVISNTTVQKHQFFGAQLSL